MSRHLNKWQFSRQACKTLSAECHSLTCFPDLRALLKSVLIRDIKEHLDVSGGTHVCERRPATMAHHRHVFRKHTHTRTNMSCGRKRQPPRTCVFGLFVFISLLYLVLLSSSPLPFLKFSFPPLASGHESHWGGAMVWDCFREKEGIKSARVASEHILFGRFVFYGPHVNCHVEFNNPIEHLPSSQIGIYVLNFCRRFLGFGTGERLTDGNVLI